MKHLLYNRTRGAGNKALAGSAAIDLGDGKPKRDCAIVAISSTTARIRVDQDTEPAGAFSLWLSACGTVRRMCVVEARDRDELIVRFVSNCIPSPKSHQADGGPSSQRVVID